MKDRCNVEDLAGTGWAQLMHGRPDELIEDAIIAATAELHGYIIVTRNVRDFEILGAKTFNPFNFSGE
jgi:hypothetical protein